MGFFASGKSPLGFNVSSNSRSTVSLQLPPGWDFSADLLGSSYYLWNPILFAAFNPRFRAAAWEYVQEEVTAVQMRFLRACMGGAVP